MPPARVLIVDDQPVFRGAARELLEARGYRVVAEADGMATALEALERDVPDAVLLDISLGEESGFDVARALTVRQPELAVVLVSADQAHESSECVQRCGARGFVLKGRLVKTDLGTYWGQAGAA
jgi:DNA-binding NarL/FixJ family response regulator